MRAFPRLKPQQVVVDVRELPPDQPTVESDRLGKAWLLAQAPHPLHRHREPGRNILYREKLLGETGT
jgi:hypothetical protein